MKYIVFDRIIDPNIRMPTYNNIIIFPRQLTHKFVAECFHAKPISAGFINLNTSYCYGESISLKLRSNGEGDTKLLKQLIGD